MAMIARKSHCKVIRKIIEDICYSEADEEIFSIQDLLEFLNRNKEDTTNEKL